MCGWKLAFVVVRVAGEVSTLGLNRTTEVPSSLPRGRYESSELGLDGLVEAQ